MRRSKDSDPGLYTSLCAAMAAALFAPDARARPMQIIHTNDLHSHLEHATDPGVGGYAAVKATIDRLKADAAARGIESLVLDAGDFTEGSKFYLAGKGEMVWRAMETMGYDAVTIGNHDWLQGPDDLNWVIGAVRPSFQFLGANFVAGPRHEHIQRSLKPYAQFRKAGLSIGVLGLTTHLFVWSWRAEDAQLTSPMHAAFKTLKEMRPRTDIIVALTHLGYKNDLELAKKTAGIDLIVGGHSHTELFKPLYQVDQRGIRVPIVQAGDHGQYVGDLLVDVEPGQPVAVLRYQLVPISTQGPRDPVVEQVVAAARARLDADYGHAWLNEVVAYSEVPLTRQGKQGPTVWSQLAADAIREAAGAELALDIPEFTGLNQPAGPVTRERIFTLYPRMFDFRDRLGWNVWTARVRGWLLNLAIKEGRKRGAVFGTSNVTWDESLKKGKLKIKNIRIGGRKIRPLRLYQVAFPEGIARGAAEIADVLRLIIRDPRSTGVPIWTAIETKMRSLGVITGPTDSVLP